MLRMETSGYSRRMARWLGSLALVSLLVAGGSNAAAVDRGLTTGLALSTFKDALERNGELLPYQDGQARILNCDRRASKQKILCSASWHLGDTGYEGTGAVWLSAQTGYPLPHYAYRFKRTDYYCLSQLPPGSDCVDLIIFR